MAAQTAAAFTTLGPGDVEIELAGGTAGAGTSFACEVLGGKVTHEYNEVGKSRTMLCGQKRGSSEVRSDGIELELENDLTASGLYKYLLDHDGKAAKVSWTPHTAASTGTAAKWVLDGLTLRLPADIGADEYGAPIASKVAWAGGTATFTPEAPATVTP